MNGMAYLFRVRSVNAAGVGLPTANTAPITPRTIPGVPLNVVATPGAGAVALAWTAPASNGGAPITDYIIRVSADDGLTWATFVDAVSAATATTVTGLVRGRNYLFRVRALNAAGMGLPSANTAAVTR